MTNRQLLEGLRKEIEDEKVSVNMVNSDYGEECWDEAYNTAIDNILDIIDDYIEECKKKEHK